MKTTTYNFTVIENCLMCRKSTRDARVLGLRLNRSQGRSPRDKTGIAVTICKCKGCGMNFPQPLPSPKSISDHYGIPPESYWKPDYFHIDPLYFSRQIKDAKRLLSFKEGMTALDIGAGIGKASLALAHAGFSVWAIEPSEPFYNKALEFTGMRKDRLQLASVEDASLPRDFFDFITFGAALEHLQDPASSIEKSITWLKPGGVIQIEVPSANHLMPTLLNLYYRLAATNYVTNLSPMHPPYHLYAFTLASFLAHGKRAGYAVPFHYVDVASIRHVPKIMRIALHRFMEWRGLGQQLTVWLQKNG